MKTVSVRQAMQAVADYPNMIDDDIIQHPVHELVCRALFEIANTPDQSVRGSLSRSNTAREMILNRMVGKRRAGSHPATRTTEQIEFVDLTAGAISE